MLAPFAALLARTPGVEHWALTRAAKALRSDPARYQSVEGIEYDLTPPSMFRWEIEFGAGARVVGVVGLFPLGRLTPHEGTTPALADRPRYPVQIRPVMALVDELLPATEPCGPAAHFRGMDHHIVTPVAAVAVEPDLAVIADGHHRVAAARRSGGDPLIMTMFVSTRGLQLDAGAFHRVFDVAVEAPAAIAGCTVVDEPTRQSIRAGRMAIVTAAGSVGVGVTDPVVDPYRQGLPAGLAADFVLPALGLTDEPVRYVDTIADAMSEVDAGATAIILPGSRVSSVMRAASEGVTLPPKSTRFRPKPVRGMLMRPVPD